MFLRILGKRNYRQISEFEIDRIIGLHVAGIGFPEIARREILALLFVVPSGKEFWMTSER